MHPIQAMINGMNKAFQEERATSQMTLGKLIDCLASQKPDKQVTGFGSLGSYRGYYDDLAFEPTADVETVGALLQRCRDAMGKVFQGYKGGGFQMGESTPLWISHYGTTGERLMGLDVGGEPFKPVTAPDEP
jgi:hypothetical protein